MEEMEEFYLRYYVGHKGMFVHEFLEFEFRSNGMLRYANNSNYKNDTMVRKQVYATPAASSSRARYLQLPSVFHFFQFWCLYVLWTEVIFLAVSI